MWAARNAYQTRVETNNWLRGIEISGLQPPRREGGGDWALSWCVLVRALASGDLQLSKSKSVSYCSRYVGLELKPLVADVEYKGKFCQGNYKKSSLH